MTTDTDGGRMSENKSATPDPRLRVPQEMLETFTRFAWMANDVASLPFGYRETVAYPALPPWAVHPHRLSRADRAALIDAAVAVAKHEAKELLAWAESAEFAAKDYRSTLDPQ